MIVCVCNNISDREIRQAIDLGVTSMEGLRDDLGVATCCGQCFASAKHVLHEALHPALHPNAESPRLLQPLIKAIATA